MAGPSGIKSGVSLRTQKLRKDIAQVMGELHLQVENHFPYLGNSSPHCAETVVWLWTLANQVMTC